MPLLSTIATSRTMAKKNTKITPFGLSRSCFLVRLREERERLTWRVDEICGMLDLTASGYRDIEDGHREIRLSDILILTVLHFDVQFLFTGLRSVNIEDHIAGRRGNDFSARAHRERLEVVKAVGELATLARGFTAEELDQIYRDRPVEHDATAGGTC